MPPASIPTAVRASMPYAAGVGVAAAATTVGPAADLHAVVDGVAFAVAPAAIDAGAPTMRALGVRIAMSVRRAARRRA